MPSFRVGLVLGAIIALLAVIASRASAVMFKFTTIDAPGASSTVVNGINDANQIVGSYDDTAGTHGFLLESSDPNCPLDHVQPDGTCFTTIDFPNSLLIGSGAHGINNAGQIVGIYYQGTFRGYVYKAGTFTTIFRTGQNNTLPNGINAGKIVGTSDPLGGFVSNLSGTTFTTIMSPSGGFALVNGINDIDQIVGSYSHGLVLLSGFLLNQGSYTTIDAPFAGTFLTVASGINHAGQIVGTYNDLTNHGFLLDHGTYSSIDVPDAETNANGINSAGQIVGSYTTDRVVNHGFLAEVVTEPVPVDIKPQSCPTPLNTNAQGVLPVAILGTSTFDVRRIDASTVRLEGVPAIGFERKDVATPSGTLTGKTDCQRDCTAAGPDGFQDLLLTFKGQPVIAALGPVTDGQCVVVHLTGNLLDGTAITGEDVVIVLQKR